MPQPATDSAAPSGTQPDKTTTLREAIASHVFDGATVALEGFTHLIPTAAGHEIIRQQRRDLTVVRMTADIIVDQMIAAGCVSRLVSSFVGNSTAGSLGELRRRIETGEPEPLHFEEYSHYGMICRYLAGAQRLPFYPLRSYAGSDIPSVNPQIRKVTSPYPGPDGGTEEIYVVPRSTRTSPSCTPNGPIEPATPRSGASPASKRKRSTRPRRRSWSSKKWSPTRSSGPIRTAPSSPPTRWTRS